MNHPSSIEHNFPLVATILPVLAYFAVFRHPLTAGEIVAFCGEQRTDFEAIRTSLSELVKKGVVHRFGTFYQLFPDPSWAISRQESNRRAEQMLPRAKRMARFIGRFPFVRAVMVSGSLSKNCMAPDGDVDYFIVTTPGRLWLARTLLVLYKKTVLLNSHRYFCINYFVDEKHLEIEEKNRFTATESVTLLPLWGGEYYARFCRENAWAWAYFPNLKPRSVAEVPATSRGWIKQKAEWLLSGAFGQWLDQKAMQVTVGFWKRKFRHLDTETFDLALKSRRGVSKHHPLHFQKKVLERYEENLAGMGILQSTHSSIHP